jgi:transcription elongation factor GreA
MAAAKKTTDQNIPKDAFLTTEEWLQKLKDELVFLEWERRVQIADRLKEAISYWDLSENSEYAEAKEEQAFNEAKIIETKKKIQTAHVVTEEHWSTVNLWSEVKVENITLWEKEEYKIVWTTEVKPFEWKISNQSPLWSALIWKKKWDKFKFEAPWWEYEYKITSVK